MPYSAFFVVLLLPLLSSVLCLGDQLISKTGKPNNGTKCECPSNVSVQLEDQRFCCPHGKKMTISSKEVKINVTSVYNDTDVVKRITDISQLAEKLGSSSSDKNSGKGHKKIICTCE